MASPRSIPAESPTRKKKTMPVSPNVAPPPAIASTQASMPTPPIIIDSKPSSSTNPSPSVSPRASTRKKQHIPMKPSTPSTAIPIMSKHMSLTPPVTIDGKRSTATGPSPSNSSASSLPRRSSIGKHFGGVNNNHSVQDSPNVHRGSLPRNHSFTRQSSNSDSPGVRQGSLSRDNSFTRQALRPIMMPKLGIPDEDDSNTSTLGGVNTAPAASPATATKAVAEEEEEIQYKLPTPLSPAKCPLYCCFYSEFDNVVGPKVCFQCPEGFMDLDIAISTEEAQQCLKDAFEKVKARARSDRKRRNGRCSKIVIRTGSGGEGEMDDNKPDNPPARQDNIQGAAKSSNDVDLTQSGENTSSASNDPPNRNGPSSSQHQQDSMSIFDTTSEYIITGHELADQMICLTTHNMHILSLPTIICNSRYERNSLLFSVGFVLRGHCDEPRPFRPLLAKLASTLAGMEVESQFLTKPATRPKIQKILEAILVSLNSKRTEANLLLNEANHMNLKLFQPPNPPATPVPDFVVPVLLRPEWQLQMYDWDLTINWIVPHIDGFKHTSLISSSSEVDMEMVRACLRILKHHGALALVDIFRYSNIYESTSLASSMLSGCGHRTKDLLQNAFLFCSKASTKSSGSSGTAQNAGDAHPNHHHASHSSAYNVGLDLSTSSHSRYGGGTLVPPATVEPRAIQPLSSSAHDRHPRNTMIPSSSLYGASSPSPMSYPPTNAESTTGHIKRMSSVSSKTTTASHCNQHMNASELAAQRKEQRMIKAALAQLYCMCSRNMSFGEMFLDKITQQQEQHQRKNRSSSSSLSSECLSMDKRPKDEQSKDDMLRMSTTTSTNKAPMGESSLSSQFDNKSRQDNSTTSPNKKEKRFVIPNPPPPPTTTTDVNWKEAFKLIDHRRFVTFGVINGLIRRVHEYPLAYDILPNDNNDADGNGDEDNNDNDNDEEVAQNESIGLGISPSSPHTRDDQFAATTTGDHNISISAPNSPCTIPTNPNGAGGRVEVALNDNSTLFQSGKEYSKVISFRKDNKAPGAATEQDTTNTAAAAAANLLLLAKQVAASMDGTKCDDELSCLYGKTLPQLIDLVKSTRKKDVTSVYSTARY